MLLLPANQASLPILGLHLGWSMNSLFELHVHVWASLDQNQQLLQEVSCNMHESGQTFAELSCLHVCTCKADVQSWGWVRADKIALARFSPHRLS